jgi:HAD superfamily hydrolase (TIGR01509 family)
VIRAVILDLDGVLIDSEAVWDDVRRQLTLDRGGRWSAEAQGAMMGMSSLEWSRYMHEVLGVPDPPEAINRAVVERMLERYAGSPPWLPGAIETVRRLSGRWPLGLASSSNREVIDAVLTAGGIAAAFGATVSSEEVARGKPAPDVYLEAARRLGFEPSVCVAVEDSRNGIRSAKAAGMRCVAVPNAHYPPGEAAGEADAIVGALGALTAEVIDPTPVAKAAPR